MGKTLIFGHQSPDTDAICSAIVYADLKTKLGMDVEAVRLGSVNSETQYALDAFQVTAPRLVEQVAGETDTVILVDHNERQQSVSDIEQVRVLEVIDHHRIANFETSAPLYYRAEPIGCTATILCKMYEEKGVAISKPMAGLMLSAIISDSLLFKSPTCTEEEVQAAGKLAAIAGVDAEQYGLDMLKAGTNLSGKTAEQLADNDGKEFKIGGAKVFVSQVNAVNVEDVYARQPELEAVIAQRIAERELALFILVATDILHQNSDILALGTSAPIVEKAFKTELKQNRAFLPGVVSRKLQIIPALTEAFQQVV